MAVLQRNNFSAGWSPDADALEAPPGTLLRSDNLILDDRNAMTLRRGSTKINSVALPAAAHSLFTAVLDGIRYRMWGVANDVYANGLSLSQAFAGSGDIQFESYKGQIFMARGSTRLKYDGTTVRNWGIEMTGGAASAALNSGSIAELASFDSTESPAFTWVEDNGTGPGFTNGIDGTANGAAVLIGHQRGRAAVGEIQKVWASPQDFSMAGANVFTDETYLLIDVFLTDYQLTYAVNVSIDLDDGSFTNYLFALWTGADAPNSSDPSLADWGTDENPGIGWMTLKIRLGDMIQYGDASKTLATVKAVRVQTFDQIVGADGNPVYFDNLRIGGFGDALPAPDTLYKYVYVRDDGTYVARSAPSDPTAVEVNFIPEYGVVVTIPADLSRDTQVTEIWLYRYSEELGGYYRVATYDNGGAFVGTGAIMITDTTLNADALTTNLAIVNDIIRPPEDIIDIEGPYYDRMFVLTATHLYYSYRLRPDDFAEAQAIEFGGAEETALWVRRALGGLYIGTTQDIYRLDGTGAELPDGSIDFTKTNLNIDNPPYSDAVTQEGNFLVYLAADGWRAIAGAGSEYLVGQTSSLYRGRTRHGVSPVNIDGRFRAALVDGELTCITPEGADSADSPVLYRRVFRSGHWYRHTYPSDFVSIYREPDGTLAIGDTSGFVWELDVGTDDGGTSIPIVIWTPNEDFDRSFSPKVVANLSVAFDTGGVSDLLTINLHRNESGSAIITVSDYRETMGWRAFNIDEEVSAEELWHACQLRMTGSFTAFRLGAWAITYHALPFGLKAWDSGPMDIGMQDMIWARRVRLKVRAGGDLLVTPYMDGVQFPSTTITVGDYVNRTTIFDVDVGRGFLGLVPRFTIVSDCPFHPYWVEFKLRRGKEDTDQNEIRVPAGLGGDSQDDVHAAKV